MNTKYNICEQCELATDDCEKEGCQRFYPADNEGELVCPYCGYTVDDMSALGEMGLLEGGIANIDCDNCGNAMEVVTTVMYVLTASPVNENAVRRSGHSHYKDDGEEWG